MDRSANRLYQLRGSTLNNITPQQFAELRKDELLLPEKKWGFMQWLGVVFSFGFWRPKKTGYNTKHVTRAKKATGYKLLCECGLVDEDAYKLLFGDLWQKNEEELQTYLEQPQEAKSEENVKMSQLDAAVSHKNPQHAAYLAQCRENEQANRAKVRDLLQQFKADPLYSTDSIYANAANELEHYLNLCEVLQGKRKSQLAEDQFPFDADDGRPAL